jgi:hypothetical protein
MNPGLLAWRVYHSHWAGIVIGPVVFSQPIPRKRSAWKSIPWQKDH